MTHQGEQAVPDILTGEGELAQDFLSQVGAHIRTLRRHRSLTVSSGWRTGHRRAGGY